jgi:hypothetical protein
MAKTMVILGPYILIRAAFYCLPVRFRKVLDSYIPKILPTVKLASIILLPSKGSNATAYLVPPNPTSLVVSSLEATMHT